MNTEKINENALSKQEIGQLGQDEIELRDIANFLKNHKVSLSISAFIGFFLAALIGFQSGIYESSLIITNDAKIDPMKFKRIKMNLPRLAYEIPDLSDSERSKFKSESYWAKAIFPTFGLTKNDYKEAGIIDSKDGAVIINFVLNEKARSKDDAEKGIYRAATYFKNAAALIQLKDLIQHYAYEAELEYEKLKKEIIETNNKNEILKKRALDLTALHKRFPQKSQTNLSQIQNFNEESIKFLPLEVQIVATESEIKRNNESINEKLAQIYEIQLKTRVRIAYQKIGGEKNAAKSLSAVLDGFEDLEGDDLSAGAKNFAKSKIKLELLEIVAMSQTGFGQRTSVITNSRFEKIIAMSMLGAFVFTLCMAAFIYVREKINHKHIC